MATTASNAAAATSSANISSVSSSIGMDPMALQKFTTQMQMLKHENELLTEQMKLLKSEFEV